MTPAYLRRMLESFIVEKRLAKLDRNLVERFVIYVENANPKKPKSKYQFDDSGVLNV